MKTALFLLVAVCIACGPQPRDPRGEDENPTLVADAGETDAGDADGGLPDGTGDAGSVDPDAGSPDAGEPSLAVSVAFSCAQKNIGAFVDPTEIQTDCTVLAVDDTGQAVPVDFLTEAGELEVVSVERFVYRPGLGEKVPADVDPLVDEPYRLEGGTTHNPRDGLVTLVAYSRGTLNDTSDLREPFVDLNDNGDFDPGEEYLDTNSNGQWDPIQNPNTSVLWAATKILWSGRAAAPSSTITPSNLNVDRMRTATTDVKILDANLNVLAVSQFSYRFEFTADGAVVSTPIPARPTDSYGMTVSETGAVSGPYTQESTFRLSIRNMKQSGEETPLIVKASIDRVYAVGATDGLYIAEEMDFTAGVLR